MNTSLALSSCWPALWTPSLRETHPTLLSHFHPFIEKYIFITLNHEYSWQWMSWKFRAWAGWGQDRSDILNNEHKPPVGHLSVPLTWSTSATICFNSSSVGNSPSSRLMTRPNSSVVMVSSEFWSNSAKASLNSSTCSSDNSTPSIFMNRQLFLPLHGMKSIYLEYFSGFSTGIKCQIRDWKKIIIFKC